MFASPSPPQGNSPSYTIPSQPLPCMDISRNSKRKRRPAGTPDPDSEVVRLSPKTLLESDRYVCEICSQGFQRDQNLQMHRRRHKVPWKLLKRDTQEVRKRVFVCPEPSCLHHDPCHALGDLVGIKKHFRRKHSNHKQWVCEKCSKGYAVQSDYKAHLKTCGTRGHTCDCGRVFSRVESFIEHQDACVGRTQPELQAPRPACLSRTASITSPSDGTNISAGTWQRWRLQKHTEAVFLLPNQIPSVTNPHHNLELHLLPSSNSLSSTLHASISHNSGEKHDTQLHLSIGSTSSNFNFNTDPDQSSQKSNDESALVAMKLKEIANEQLCVAISENALADEMRHQARREIELAEQEFADAKRIRQHAQVEIDKARILKEHATKKINGALLQITCHACKQQFQSTTLVSAPADENSRHQLHIGCSERRRR
ncbi:hypothetical protein MRB53_001433 [Persea americana]|uniref:Uncharacterized protein n=1 Tax=Persea americana TaxID=3435 RepID=A0ACC2MSK9_PERAE|nr:hypothetical protein MRB53_001433 [Persea americana]|eukprot:TRINITY_DN48020_c1_g1_i2.p1 TRINITY_DN48020_c1_g1~~TRINITY_DN48020_c1_g1_i2.p1  ORF type:complete len:426 (+),score=62.52 TRINITY_DN48020_c1_g1_i2:408-1685(+)